MSDNIKNKILEIITNNPRHYTRMIKSNSELNDWILSNSYEIDNYAERIYVSINGVPLEKECGKYPKFNTIFKGFFDYCGSKTKCQCARNAQSNAIKNIHNNKSDIEKERENDKRVATLIERYGVSNPMYSVEFKEKLKETNLERYGVENPLQSKEIQEKIKQTNIEKYGFESPLQNKEIKNKIKQTNIEKYGSNHNMQFARKKLYKKYDGNPFQSKEIRKKIKDIMNEKYGVSHPLQVESFKEKSKQTSIERYGVDNPAQKHISKESLEILNSKELFCEFIKDKTVYEISKELGVESTLIYRSVKKYDAQDLYQKKGPSYLESEMKEFLDIHNIPYEINNRTILNGSELDFYIPDYAMAIEMNGVYWHNDVARPEIKYHYNKWKMCSDQKIHLVSIFEDDWRLQKEKVCNMLLGFFRKKLKGIPARKSHIVKISGKVAKPFLDQYHLQNFVTGTHYGAFDDNDNLIGVMTFGTTRNGRFELKRFVMDNYNHAGLFSKLFTYAQRDLQFNEVVSFSDNTCFTGNVYKKNGFTFIKEIKPDYRYLINGKRVHKSNYTKQRIKSNFPELCESIDNGMSEIAAMSYLGIPRIWDCGKCEWVWKSND
jgi:hypothetical protein